MTRVSKEDQALRLRFNITQTIQVKLTRLKVQTNSKKEHKSHKCHHCNYSAKTKSILKSHLYSHTGEKPFACKLCNYKSTHRHHLNRHISTHTGEKPYNCAFCKKSFRTNTETNYHEIICKLNPKQSDPSWVKMQKSFKCQMCCFSAIQKSALTHHMRTHTREKPFACTLCSYKFSLRANLRRHIFTHTREKPNKCQFCQRKFAQFTTQIQHEKICKLNPKQGDAKWVEEHKKFKCHLCKYSATGKRNLKDHLRSHTGEKPYKCPLCLYKCRHHSSIYQHMRKKHVRENGYACPECDLKTASISKLLNHMKELHVNL